MDFTFSTLLSAAAFATLICAIHNGHNRLLETIAGGPIFLDDKFSIRLVVIATSSSCCHLYTTMKTGKISPTFPIRALVERNYKWTPIDGHIGTTCGHRYHSHLFSEYLRQRTHIRQVRISTFFKKKSW